MVKPKPIKVCFKKDWLDAIFVKTLKRRLIILEMIFGAGYREIGPRLRLTNPVRVSFNHSGETKFINHGRPFEDLISNLFHGNYQFVKLIVLIESCIIIYSFYTTHNYQWRYMHREFYCGCLGEHWWINILFQNPSALNLLLVKRLYPLKEFLSIKNYCIRV